MKAASLTPNRYEILIALVLLTASAAFLEGVIYGPNKLIGFACGVSLASLLFIMRMRCRLLYGIVELGFGLYVLWDAAGRGRGSFSSDFDVSFNIFQFSVVLIQTAGAIYVLVRGLDNAFIGLPKGAKKRVEAIQEYQVPEIALGLMLAVASFALTFVIWSGHSSQTDSVLENASEFFTIMGCC
jgi:hypothetical protein